MTTFINPYTYISDPTRGRPVFNGRVFLGNPDTDPTQPENQIPVSVVNENGTLTQVPQPIRTGPGGVATFQGNPVQLDVDLVQHSMTIQDANGRQVYYSPRISIVGAANVPTDIIQQFNQFGTPRYITSANNMGNPFPYAIGARVVYNAGAGDRVYESLENNNTTLPTDTARWRIIDQRGRDTFNDARYLNESSNLSDLPNTTTARTSLGLGTSAIINTGEASGQIPLIGTPSTSGRSAVVVDAGSNTNGTYRRWSDGIIEQFTVSRGYNHTGTTITLPTSMGTTNYLCLPMNLTTSSIFNTNITSITNTNFRVISPGTQGAAARGNIRCYCVRV